MIKTQGLTHIHLAVRDLQRSLRFYREVFGLEERFWDGSEMVFLSTPGQLDLITLRQAQSGEATGAGGGIGHFGFGLRDKGDLDLAIAEVLLRGGSLIERGTFPSGEPYAYVRDPDGYVIEL